MRKIKGKTSVVTRLSFIYLILTVANVAIFWIASGSNQMRLIGEKATMSAQSISFEILRRLQPILDQNFADKKDPAPVLAGLKNKFLAALRVKRDETGLIISTVKVISTDLQVVLQFPELTPKDAPASVTADELQHAYKAIQLKDMKNEIFYGVPDLLEYRIDIYLPLTSTGGTDLVLVSRIPLESIQSELKSLLRLAIAMIVMLLILQSVVGYVIYRTLILPIKRVSEAAEELSKGEWTQIENTRKEDDEISTLVDSFNHMSVELKSKDATIRGNLADLKKKSDVAQFELSIAQRIQSAIQPKEINLGQLKSLVHYAPLYTVSGDYYDMVELPDGSIGIFLGDASGHGVPAAFLTIMVKVYFSSLVEKTEKAGDLMKQINGLMARFFEGAGLYLTAFYIRIYPDNSAEYCNCMHPSPIILKKNDADPIMLKSTGFYVGMMEEVIQEYETAEIAFDAGDRLIMYTDGITEANNVDRKQFGLQRLQDTVSRVRSESLETIKDTILKTVDEFRTSVSIDDDVSIFIVEIGEPRSFERKAGAEEKTRTNVLRGPEYTALALAIDFFHKHEFARAIEEFLKLKAGVPESDNGNLFLGESYYKLGRHSEAIPFFESYAEKHPNNRSVQLRLISCYVHANDIENAEEVALECLRQWPDQGESYAQLALVQLKSGKTAEAENNIMVALKMVPDSPKFIRIAGIVRSHRKEFDES